MWNKKKLKFNYLLISFVCLLLMICTPFLSLAQSPTPPDDPNPCDFNGGVAGGSTTCPLDTWVWVLVVVAAVAGAMVLNKRQQKQKQYL